MWLLRLDLKKPHYFHFSFLKLLLLEYSLWEAISEGRLPEASMTWVAWAMWIDSKNDTSHWEWEAKDPPIKAAGVYVKKLS